MILINSEHSNVQFFCEWKPIFTCNGQGTIIRSGLIPFCVAFCYNTSLSFNLDKKNTEPVFLLSNLIFFLLMFIALGRSQTRLYFLCLKLSSLQSHALFTLTVTLRYSGCLLALPRLSRHVILLVTPRYFGNRVTLSCQQNLFIFRKKKLIFLLCNYFLVEFLLLIFVLLYFHADW